MKLLYDNNLSHKLVARLNDLFPGSTHVLMEGLDESEDQEIWDFSKSNNFSIVTKDSDFNELSLIHGFPPKIIWIRVGNCKILDVEKIIREKYIIINKFLAGSELDIIEIN
jgi:predicted nuclease of predicted toxin-antitoxin system